MNRYDYLKEKAAKAGLHLLKSNYDPSVDAEVYALGSGKHWVGLSMSGLEILQNATDANIKDFMDARFNDSMKSLRKFSAAQN